MGVCVYMPRPLLDPNISPSLKLLAIVRPVIGALDSFLYRLHLFGLSVPFIGTHLCFSLKELLVGFSVASAKSVP